MSKLGSVGKFPQRHKFALLSGTGTRISTDFYLSLLGYRAVIGSVSAETGGDTNVQHTQSAAGTVTTDIVWALRLQKMYGNPLKELFGFGWSTKTETVGTTFDDSEDDDLDVIAVLKGEGQQGEKIRVLEDNDFNVAVVSIVGDY